MSKFEWCRLRDLNSQPPDYKSGALPVELSRQTHDLFSMEAVKFEVFSYMFFYNQHLIIRHQEDRLFNVHLDLYI